MEFKEKDILAGVLIAILQTQEGCEKLTVKITMCGFMLTALTKNMKG
jgi:hypothetical protein